MTGIERLRELAREQEKRSWSSVGKIRGRMMSDIADQIEREHDADVADSPYDATLPEDREAVAWVRERGGIEVLRRMFQDADSRRVELCVALGIDLDKGWSEAMAAMRLRLVPAGMEWLVDAWPRFEDGEPVRVGDEVCGGGRAFIVNHVVLFSNGESTVCAEADMDSGKVRDYARARPSYRLKRPAPKVYDADGAEIRVGDTVYDVEDGCELVVTKVTSDAVFVAFEDVEADKYDASQLTHRAPVLAADGRPLREGETVWGTSREQHEYFVRDLCKRGSGFGRFSILCHDVTDDKDCFCDPSQLTHERPDSVLSLYQDASELDMTFQEFERRFKALAERGQ